MTKKFNKLLACAAGISILAGCATNIARLPITPRDQEVYKNPYLKKSDSSKMQAVKVAIVPQEKNIKDSVKKQLSATFADDMDTAFSNLSDFEAVPRSEIGAIFADNELSALTSGKKKDYKIANVDYLLIYKISNCEMKPGKGLMGIGGESGKYRGTVKAKVSLIDTAENKKEFTKTISGESDSESFSDNPAESMSELNEAVENAVKDFVTQFAVQYAPPAIVQQTKGSGQVALLNVGKNYGIMKDMKVEFYTIKMKNGEKRIIPFAYGKVIDVAEESCWVDVEDFEKAGVKENNFARVRRDQSKSFLESINPIDKLD